MTDTPTIPRLALAQAIVNRWAKTLGIDDWRIHVAVQHEPDTQARAWVSFNYDESTIRISPWVVGVGEIPSDVLAHDRAPATDDQALEETLVHELLHVYLRRRDRALERLADQLDEKLQPAFRQMAHDANEEIVDRLARVLVRVSSGGPRSQAEAERELAADMERRAIHAW